MEHVTVYRDKKHWAATPANYGIWSWGDEIVVGFVVGQFNIEGGFHARDRSLRCTSMQARSLDGGLTWQAQKIPCRTPGNIGVFSADEHMLPELGARHALESGTENAPEPCPGGINFTHPDSCGCSPGV